MRNEKALAANERPSKIQYLKPATMLTFPRLLYSRIPSLQLDIDRKEQYVQFRRGR